MSLFLESKKENTSED
jgi:hypothetical protein